MEMKHKGSQRLSENVQKRRKKVAGVSLIQFWHTSSGRAIRWTAYLGGVKTLAGTFMRGEGARAWFPSVVRLTDK